MNAEATQKERRRDPGVQSLSHYRDVICGWIKDKRGGCEKSILQLRWIRRRRWRRRRHSPSLQLPPSFFVIVFYHWNIQYFEAVAASEKVVECVRVRVRVQKATCIYIYILLFLLRAAKSRLLGRLHLQFLGNPAARGVIDASLLNCNLPCKFYTISVYRLSASLTHSLVRIIITNLCYETHSSERMDAAHRIYVRTPANNDATLAFSLSKK